MQLYCWQYYYRPLDKVCSEGSEVSWGKNRELNYLINMHSFNEYSLCAEY